MRQTLLSGRMLFDPEKHCVKERPKTVWKLHSQDGELCGSLRDAALECQSAERERESPSGHTHSLAA